jgi:hypothetical protein
MPLELHILLLIIAQVIEKSFNAFHIFLFLEQIVGIGPSLNFFYRLIVVGISPNGYRRILLLFSNPSKQFVEHHIAGLTANLEQKLMKYNGIFTLWARVKFIRDFPVFPLGLLKFN